jgi:tetratricopeptide (TPR) repeat protein
VTCQQKLGWAQKNCGLYAEALDTLTKVRKDAETQISCRPILPDILVELARAYLHLGRFSPDLIQMQEKALQLCEEIWQPRHSRVGTVLNNMAIVLIWRGDYAAAEPICQRSIQVRREALGETHPYTAHSMACLAQLRYFQGNYAEAASLLRQAESFYSVRRPEPVAAARTNRARVLWRQHKHNEAIELAAAAFDALSSSHALQSSDQVATIMLDLGAMLAQRGSPDDLTKSMQLIERALAIREHLGQEHPSYLLSKKVQYETSLKLAGKPATNDVMDLTERINVSQLTLYVNYAV